MENLLVFFKILIFGKTLLLTPVSIVLGQDWIEINPEHELTVVTSGATLEVRLLKSHEMFDGLNLDSEIYRHISEALPQGTIEVELVDVDGKTIRITDRVISISNDSVSYGLMGDGGLSEDLRILQVKVRSNKTLNGVLIFWKNFKS